MQEQAIQLYQKLVLDNAKKTLIVCAVIFAFFILQIPNFKSDVSADSFLLQNDPDLLFTQKMAKKYSGGIGGDLLIIAYTPLEKDLYSPESLEKIKQLSDDIEKVDGIKEVRSILNMPLLFSPKVGLSDIQGGMRTLEEDDVDMSLARKEFQSNAFYRNAFVSADEKTTAILIMVEADAQWHDLRVARDDLKIKKLEFGRLSPKEEIALFKANREYNKYKTYANKRNADRIDEIRNIMGQHREGARMFLGGASMVVVDALSFIKNDLSKFSIGVVLFLIIALALFFRQLRWVVIPVLCCSVSTLIMVGFMGLLDWRVNPISSNFVALLLIIAMSIVIHLVVRYRELVFSYPDESQRFLVANASRAMFRPCFYTALTTMAAFTSLTISGIVPVESFGKVMTLGIGLALIVCFIVFPSVLMLMPVKKNQYEARVNSILTNALAKFCEDHGKGVMTVCIAVALLAAYGFTKLTVENRFIDYFHADTEIYQGMLEIDTKLGGTTPLDIIIDAPQSYFDELEAEASLGGDEFDEFAEFEAFEESEGEANPLADSYWFTPSKLELLIDIHEYLESLPETGQVLSIASTYKTVVRINNDQPFDSLKLQLLHSFVPDELKDLMMNPYLAEDGNQVRFSIRVIDSQENLERKVLLENIKKNLVEKFDLEDKQVRPSSFVVLYNNMLQSLFNSQFNTLGVVFLGILAMFFILFRSFKVALISIVPNLFAAGVIIGLMGIIGLPLDLMTITVAAITIGIGVDDTIHYVHRFKEEFAKDGNYIEAMKRSHRSIGMALYYTSLTIIFGFSILTASNFMPTVHFGMLTGLAMFVALVANLTLLPILLVSFKALGEGEVHAEAAY
jgi:predicted RND superfamily exporter protein